MERPDDDRSFRMVFANPAYTHHTGRRIADVLGKTLDENFPNLREQGVPQRYAAIVRTKTPQVFENIRYRNDKDIEAAYSVKAFPLPDNKIGISF